ncbi:unnamed protein product, partial [Brenthis ino]
MTTDLCGEDVIVSLTSPQVIKAEPAGRGGAGAAGARAAPGGLELGRRLLLAARAGDTAAVLDLMAKGAPFTTDWLGTSPLHLAAANNHVETCAVLLRAGVSRDARTKVERTPLHLAAHAGHRAVVALLLDHGAALDCRDMLHMTPLHWAAARGHAAAARELLRRGADARARCKFRHTPRSLAARHRRADVLALLDAAEAAAEAAALQEQMADTPKIEHEFATIQRIQDIKPQTKIKINPEKTITLESKTEPISTGAAEAEGARAEGAALLRAHGITLLPADRGCTVLTALRSGRTVVLSDAGKLMLKESGNGCNDSPMLIDDVSPNTSTISDTANINTTTGININSANLVNSAGVNSAVVSISSAGVVNSASVSGLNVNSAVSGSSAAASARGVVVRARARGARGVKVVALNKPNQPLKKIIHPSDLQQVKLVQVGGGGGDGRRPALKLLLNKANFTRLLASAAPAAPGPQPAGDAEPAAEGGLRAQLRAAHAAVARLAAELRACQDRLAKYERPALP